LQPSSDLSLRRSSPIRFLWDAPYYLPLPH
jgi:hypothetical protein